MSLANKKLNPVPVSAESGEYAKIDLQYGELKRITCVFEMEGGAENFATNIEEYAFDRYGTAYGETTCPDGFRKEVKSEYIFPDCYLEQQEINKARGNGNSVFVTKIYQEAYDTLREIEKPQTSTDENGRETTRRTYVILNTAPEANYKFNPENTLIPNPDNASQYCYKQTETVGNAVTIVVRDFIEVSSSLVQVGNDLETWTENNLKQVQQNFIVTRDYALASDGVIGTTTYNGLILSGKQFSTHDQVAATVVKRWSEKGIISVSTPLVGGNQAVSVGCIGMTDAEVAAEVAKVTNSHILIDTSISNFEGFQGTNYTFEVDDFEIIEYSENGLKRLSRVELSETDFSEGEIVIGTTTYSTLYAAGQEIDNGNAIKKRSSSWAQAGVLNATKQFTKDNLLYVTFQSQGTKFTPTALNAPTYALTDDILLAFQGGPAASLLTDRINDVSGFRKYVVTVFMNSDGTQLDDGSDNEIYSYQKWLPYKKPGLLEITLADGPVAYPAPERYVLANVTHYISTNGDLGVSFKPFSVTRWSNYNFNYIPTDTGLPVSEAKGASGYLADSSFAASNTTFIGIPVDSITGSASSNPTPSVFDALTNQVIDSDNDPAFTTDEGVQWYRKVKVQVVGAFGDYL